MKLKNRNTGTDRRIYEDEQGVSPVIAVILMVAITVVMAAIVSSWSSGVKAPTTPTTVGLDIARSGNNITVVVTSIDPSSASPLPYINSTYTNATAKVYGNMSSVDVGHSVTLNTNEIGPNQLVVVASYKDGSKKVLYSRDI